MTITYSGTITSDLDRVRLYIQDTVNGSGPKPNDGNFTDEELYGLIAVEGSWQGAVAAAFETLAAAWRRYPTFSADGLSLNRSGIADGYLEQARQWRQKAGGGMVKGAAPVRVDGYSHMIASDEV